MARCCHASVAEPTAAPWGHHIQRHMMDQLPALATFLHE
jgi:hypothetical protein